MIPCPGCGKRLPWRKFKPHFKDSGSIALLNRPLCCYQTKCACGNSADWNKEYVTDEWAKDNPHKKIARLIN